VVIDKTTLAPGDVVVGNGPDAPMIGLHRILEVISRMDRVTLIPIPSPRNNTNAKQTNYYAKGFYSKRLSDLLLWLETNAIQKTTLTLPNHWFLSDENLRKLVPPTNSPEIPLADRHRSPLEIRRNFKMMLIEPLISVATKTTTGTRPPDLTCLDGLVRARALEAGVSIKLVFDALHRYYAFGSIKNALLPNNTGRSGAPGTARRAKNGVKLGRKNAAVKAGNLALAGLALAEKDIANIQDGYHAFVRPGTKIREAYYSMCATYYSSGHVKMHGYWTAQLLEAHQRPTEGEFAYHGPAGKDEHAAARRMMGEGHWAKNFRPLAGTARDGITMIGQVASLDASPIDVNQVACGNPLQPIGVGRGLFVRDAWLGLYMGWHVGIDSLGTEDAKLAILRAATDKAAMLARYNLELPSEDFPSLFFSRYLSDNGELRSRDGMESIVDELSSRIEFVSSGRADRNSSSESGHHSRHANFDHHLTGTTKGRQARRGEPLAITKALLTRYAYMRLLLLWIHWANTKQELPLHMIPTEMRREFSAQGKTPNRSRIEVYRWALANGYVSGKPTDPTYLRAHLLPKFKASIQRGGLVLHRPKTGNTVELLHGAKFSNAYLAHAGIIQAATRGRNHIEVSADPDDLSQVYLIDQQGIHAIPNIRDDVLFIHEGGIPDLCALNDAQKLDQVVGSTRRDQDGVDQQSFRNEEEADAKALQVAAREKLGGQRAPSRKRAGVRDAQAAERRAELNNEVRRVRGQDDKEAQQHGPDLPPAIPPPPQSGPALTTHDTPAGSVTLLELRKAQLARFKNERKFS
jgi:hypothetical protein